jgi:hypothetical protein
MVVGRCGSSLAVTIIVHWIIKSVDVGPKPCCVGLRAGARQDTGNAYFLPRSPNAPVPMPRISQTQPTFV